MILTRVDAYFEAVKDMPDKIWNERSHCMNDAEQLKHFVDDLDKLVDRYRDEYEISFGAVIGALQLKSYLICQEAQSREDEV